MDNLTSYVRGFCELIEPPRDVTKRGSREVRRATNRAKAKALPDVALVWDTETTTGEEQRLTFGSFCVLLREGNNYNPNPASRGLFYADGPGVPAGVRERLETIAVQIARDSPEGSPRLEVLSQTEFLEVFYEVAYRQRGLVVNFHSPFDISRIARDARPARKGSDFSFILWPKTRSGVPVLVDGKVIDRPYRPRITIKSLGSHKAAINFTSVRTTTGADDVLSWAQKKAKRIELGRIPAPWETKAESELTLVEQNARALLAVPKAERATIEERIRTEYLEKYGHFEGRFLDLHVLGRALTDKSMTHKTACKAFGVKPKGEPGTHPGWDFDEAYGRYNLNDTESTSELLVAMLAKYALHSIDLPPDKAYSPASIGKAYLRAMGITPPLERWPDFAREPLEPLGVSQVAFFGGRTAVRNRRAVMPGVYVDVLSAYSTVNALLRNIDILRAKNVRVVKCTDEAQTLLSNISLEKCFNPETWPSFSFFALVEMDGEGLFPVRAIYEPGDSPRIGIVHANGAPAWYAGPDAVASVIMTGKVPKILRAIRIEPVRNASGEVELLEGLRPVEFLSAVQIDPRTDDVFARIIEERQRIKADKSLPTEERDWLDKGLKCEASATGFGIFAETNVQGERDLQHVLVHSGDESFPIETDAPEKPGPFAFPSLSSLITAGARLLLAMLERSVTDCGGSYVLEDTDSIFIISTQSGGPVPCPNGPLPRDSVPYGYKGPEQHANGATHALSWAEVDVIAERFRTLSPYDRTIVPGSILKVEDINFRPDGSQRQLWAYAISSKRYATFELVDGEPSLTFAVDTIENDSGEIEEKTKTQLSESALGALKVDSGNWIDEFWLYIIRGALGLAQTAPAWFPNPVVATMPISAPGTWEAFTLWNAGKSYDDSVKPYGFGLTVRATKDEQLPIVMADVEMEEREWNARVRDLARAKRDRARSANTKLTVERSTELAHRELRKYRPNGQLGHAKMRLFAPRVPAARWLDSGRKSPWFDMHSGRQVTVVVGPQDTSYYTGDFSASDYHEFARYHALHPESKSVCADGAPCTLARVEYRGPLGRRSIAIGSTDVIGKESQGLNNPLVTALGALASEYQIAIFRSGRINADSEAQKLTTLLGGLSYEAVARKSRKSRAFVARLAGNGVGESPNVALGTPGTRRVIDAARELSRGPGTRDRIAMVAKRRKSAAVNAEARALYERRLAQHAPYWEALDIFGGIVPDMCSVGGRWFSSAEFENVPKRLLKSIDTGSHSNQTSIPRGNREPGNLDAIVAFLVERGTPAMRDSTLAFYAATKRPTFAQARREVLANRAIESDALQRIAALRSLPTPVPT